MGTMWGPRGCTDQVGTTWGQHEDNVETTWEQCGDHRDVCAHPWVGVWVDGWVSGSMGGIRSNTKNLINLELIEIIQFCLKIYDL